MFAYSVVYCCCCDCTGPPVSVLSVLSVPLTFLHAGRTDWGGSGTIQSTLWSRDKLSLVSTVSLGRAGPASLPGLRRSKQFRENNFDSQKHWAIQPGFSKRGATFASQRQLGLSSDWWEIITVTSLHFLVSLSITGSCENARLLNF